MITVDISDIRRGSIFADCFDDVRLYDSLSYMVGEHYNIEVRGLFLGVARIETIHAFPFKSLHESVSQRYYGKHAAYMASILKRMYETPQYTMNNETRMMQLLFKWTERNIHNQEGLLQKFWEKQKEDHYSPVAAQSKLFA